MKLDDFLASFAAMTGDAIAISFRVPDEEEARVVWVNDGFTDMFGYSRDDILGQFVRIVNDPSDRDAFLQQINPQVAAGRSHLQAETYCLTKSGARVWSSISMFIVPVEGGRFFAAIFRDLSDLKQRELDAERALAERDTARNDIKMTQTRLVESINSLPEPFSIWNAERKLVLFNDSFRDMVFGGSDSAKSGLDLEYVVRHIVRNNPRPAGTEQIDEDIYVAELMRRLCAGPTLMMNETFEGRSLRTKSYWAANGDMMVLTMDVTEIEKQRKKVERYAEELTTASKVAHHQALHDELTGLGNRRYLSEQLSLMVDRRKVEGGDICAMHLDLDRFKQVNDTQGHKVGDKLLQVVAEVLLERTEPKDIVARVGGDEFLIVRSSLDTNQSPQNTAQEIIDWLSKPMKILGQHVRIGASVGLASTRVSDEAELLVNSDVALYKAKSAGRGTFAYFSRSDLDHMAEVKILSDDILRGLDAGEFVPVFQPQVCARTGALIGLEALARWDHPTKGLLVPAVFLHLADELNVLERIDRAIFDRAIVDASAHFKTRTAPSLSFNVSEARLMSRTLLQDAERAGSYPGEVAFELLESVFLDDDDTQAQMQIDALKELGVGLEIDDFGSGHASIIGLEKVGPDRLKIDQRLIAPITASSRSLRLVRSIVDIGSALKIGVTAEGVETAEHAVLLRDIGCDRLQGYFFSPPVRLCDLDAALARHKNVLDGAAALNWAVR